MNTVDNFVFNEISLKLNQENYSFLKKCIKISLSFSEKKIIKVLIKENKSYVGK